MHVLPLGRCKMEEKIIRKYAQIMQDLDLTKLEINECGTVISLEREAQAKKPVLCEDFKTEDSTPDLIDFCSPMVGIFYSAPAENEAPFVKVGDKVHKGDVLCIIEAMKLMNEIVAEQDGIIEEICVENNQVVDFGHVLFRYRKDKE